MERHQLNLKPQPFSMIASGKKTFELRLLDEKRRLIAPGDEILFVHTEDAEKTLLCRVVSLYPFPNFEVLYRSLPLEKCGYEADEVATASPADMDMYYSKERQDQYGVVGIEIELVRERI